MIIIISLKDPPWAGNLKSLKHTGLISWYYIQITTLKAYITLKIQPSWLWKLVLSLFIHVKSIRVISGFKFIYLNWERRFWFLIRRWDSLRLMSRLKKTTNVRKWMYFRRSYWWKSRNDRYKCAKLRKCQKLQKKSMKKKVKCSWASCELNLFLTFK